MSEVIVLVDLGFGDAGKGTSTDALTRKHGTRLIVRYSGGNQAAHNVVTDNGLHHMFAQFGAGTLASPSVSTLLSPGMLVNPLNLMVEGRLLTTKGADNVFSRIMVHEDCLMVTPFHAAMNRIREKARGIASGSFHGSCGCGIGEVREYANFMALTSTPGYVPTIGMVRTPKILREALQELKVHMQLEAAKVIDTLEGLSYAKNVFDNEKELLSLSVDELMPLFEEFRAAVPLVNNIQAGSLINGQTSPIIFEGAQGILLDERYGFYPYNTWTDTTGAQAYNFLEAVGFQGSHSTYGIMRTFPTRHGAGPFPTEDIKLSAALPDPHNPFGPWQHEFRVGHPDLPLLQYALDVQRHIGHPLNGLIVTHVDWLQKLKDLRKSETHTTKVATRYSLDGQHYEIPLDKESLNFARTLDVATVDVHYEEFYLNDLLALYRAKTGLPFYMTSHGPKTGDKTFFEV